MKPEELFLIIVLAFFTLFMMSISLEMALYPKRRRQTIVKVYELLLKGIEQGTMDEENIYRMYNRFNEHLSGTFISFKVPYERFLVSFEIYVREKDKDGKMTKNVIQILKPILTKIKDENPYANVNEGQRRILLSIEDTMKKSSTITTSERAAIKHNLNELAVAIEDKQKELSWSKKVNKWTVPISIIGVIATFVFGIIQLTGNH